MLARRTEALVTHTVFKQSSKQGLSETLAPCALWAAIGHPTPTQRPNTTTSGTHSFGGNGALPHGEVLQPLLTAEEMGKVALSCRFACDTRYHLMGGNPASLSTPSDVREKARRGGGAGDLARQSWRRDSA